MNADLPATLTDPLLCRICNEYLEMPGLRLTRQQAQRLWGLDQETCCQVLELLVESKFLFQTADGMYQRLTEGRTAFPPLRMAKARLDPSTDAGAESSHRTRS